VLQIFGKSANPRPKLCPSCGTLVGATATRCHQCGANVNFSFAAANKALARLMPATSPATYAILGLSCILYGISLLWSIRMGGGGLSGGGLFGFDIGVINGQVLLRMGESLPLVYNLQEPWRFVTAVFLHASILHIGFNMWFLMDVGPLIEELYGSARLIFIYVFTGVCGYVLASLFASPAIGGSGALLGLIGVLLAMSMGRQTAGMQMLRRQLVYLLIYILVISFLPGISLLAHVGGFVSGFVLGKILTPQKPITPGERKVASVLGWGSALIVVASFAMIVISIVQDRI
jgi:rhomboid protease GluP